MEFSSGHGEDLRPRAWRRAPRAARLEYKMATGGGAGADGRGGRATPGASAGIIQKLLTTDGTDDTNKREGGLKRGYPGHIIIW